MSHLINSGQVEILDEVDIIKRWSGLGLLEQINDDDLKKIIAYTYEATAKIIISAETGGFKEYVDTMVFPMIYRILIKNKEIVFFDEKIIEKFAHELLSDINNVITEQIEDLIKTHAGCSNVDIEAEFCANYCNNFDLTKYFN